MPASNSRSDGSGRPDSQPATPERLRRLVERLGCKRGLPPATRAAELLEVRGRGAEFVSEPASDWLQTWVEDLELADRNVVK
jgi:hypothetical protein